MLHSQVDSIDEAGPTPTPSSPISGVSAVWSGEDLAQSVARARASAGLFGLANAVQIGRYQVLSRVGRGGGGEVWSAWDPELGRRVALKRILTTGTHMRERVRREGQALARLSHPNVVPVYDVLEIEERVVLVMELIEGQTLREWVHGQKLAAIVRAYRQAADGLAAVHRVGLVHRDIKPDNMVMGRDHRVRLLDFGLAIGAVNASAEAINRGAGTPRYGAPEQLAGEAVDATADHYALCQSLQEALHGNRIRPPRWLAKVLECGLARDPKCRFTSTEALVRALAWESSRRRWQWGAVAALLTTASTLIGLIGVASRPAIDAHTPATCTAGPAAIASAWNFAKMAALVEHFERLQTPYATATIRPLTEKLDSYARQWSSSYDQACRKRQIDEPLAELNQRRSLCLAQAGVALTTLVELLQGSTALTLPNIAAAATGLPDIEPCNDDAALLLERRTMSHAPSARALALDDALIDLRMRLAAEVDDAKERASRVLRQAHEVADELLLAQAWLLHGRAHLGDNEGDRGIRDFARAMELALQQGNDHLAVEAFARKAWALATTGANAREAREGVEIMEALAKRLEHADFERALLANNFAAVDWIAGQKEQAQAGFERAQRLAQRARGLGSYELLNVDTNLAMSSANDVERERVYQAALIRHTRVLGPQHPRTMKLQVSLAMLTRDDTQAYARLAAACTHLQAVHPSLGRNLAECWYELAAYEEDRRQPAQAIAHLRQVLTFEAQGAEPPRIALAHGHLERLQGKRDAARSWYTKVLTQVDDRQAPWWERVFLAHAELGLALVADQGVQSLRGQSHLARALAWLQPIVKNQGLLWVERHLKRAQTWAKPSAITLRGNQ